MFTTIAGAESTTSLVLLHCSESSSQRRRWIHWQCGGGQTRRSPATFVFCVTLGIEHELEPNAELEPIAERREHLGGYLCDPDIKRDGFAKLCYFTFPFSVLWAA